MHLFFENQGMGAVSEPTRKGKETVPNQTNPSQHATAHNFRATRNAREGIYFMLFISVLLNTLSQKMKGFIAVIFGIIAAVLVIGYAASFFGDPTAVHESMVMSIETQKMINDWIIHFFENGWTIFATIFSLLVSLVFSNDCMRYRSRKNIFCTHFGIETPSKGVTGWDWKDRKIIQPLVNIKLIELAVHIDTLCKKETEFLEVTCGYSENTAKRINESLIVLENMKREIQNAKDSFFVAKNIAYYFGFIVLSYWKEYAEKKKEDEKNVKQKRDAIIHG